MLVIRAWREGGLSVGVRARLTQTVDATVPGREETVVAGEAEILAAVRFWLEAFAATN